MRPLTEEHMEGEVMLEIPRPPRARCLVESFFSKITFEQFWRMASSEPDSFTNTLLAELLLELTASVSCAVLTHTGRAAVREASVRPAVGDTITYGFGVTPRPEDQVQREAVGLLRDLMVQEVVMNVNSIKDIKWENKKSLHVTAPCRLSAMLLHACRLFSSISSMTAGFEVFSLSFQFKKLSIDDAPPEDDRPEAPGPSGRLWKQDVSQAIFKVISQRADEVSAPLLVGIQGSDGLMGKPQISLEIHKVAHRIAQQHLRAASRGGAGKIESLLAVQFIHALIAHIMEELRVKYRPGLDTWPALPLYSIIYALVCRTHGHRESPLDQMNGFWRLKHAFSGEDHVFVVHLLNAICKHFPQTSDAVLVDEAWLKVQCCLGLTSWWLNTQAIHQGAEVWRRITEPERQEARMTSTNPFLP